MIGNARKLVIGDETFYWTTARDGGIVLDLGKHGKHHIGLAYADPDYWYCDDSLCDCGHFPPSFTPSTAAVLARIMIAPDLTLEPGVEIEHVWKVTAVTKL